MSIVIWVPKDTAAVSAGANEIAQAIERSKKRGLDVVVKRNGSRGMFFLEPLVEVETAQGRVAYGPVDASDVECAVRCGF